MYSLQVAEKGKWGQSHDMKNGDIFYLDAAEKSPKGRLDYGVKIKKLLLFVDGLCNVLIFWLYAVAEKKA